MLYNKREAVERLYKTDTFDFDCALPHDTVTIIINELIQTKRIFWNQNTSDKTFSELWSLLHQGTVYAYCRKSGRSGFLPITNDALEVLYLYNELHRINVIFTPIIEI
jgi:hypothetical protein